MTFAEQLQAAERELANARGEHFAYLDARSLVRYTLPYQVGEQRALDALDNCVERAKLRLTHAIHAYNLLRLLPDCKTEKSE